MPHDNKLTTAILLLDMQRAYTKVTEVSSLERAQQSREGT